MNTRQQQQHQNQNQNNHQPHETTNIRLPSINEMIPEYIRTSPSIHQYQHHHQLHPDPYIHASHSLNSFNNLTKWDRQLQFYNQTQMAPRHDSISSISSSSSSSISSMVSTLSSSGSSPTHHHTSPPTMVPPPNTTTTTNNTNTTNNKKRRGNLPKQVTEILRSWLDSHIQHPYPTDEEKSELMKQTGLTLNQVSNWFINARRRRLPAMNRNYPKCT